MAADLLSTNVLFVHSYPHPLLEIRNVCFTLILRELLMHVS